MSNTFFQFKEFRIDQKVSSLKVTTEACIFGAWIGNKMDQPSRALDIGTGTGILSMMLAQVWPRTTFDAVELDKLTALEAKDNFRKCLWSDRLAVTNQSIQDYHPEGKYELIISNPPFFAHSLKSQNDRNNFAKHELTLEQGDLLNAAKSLLNETGGFAVIYPPSEAKSFEVKALSGGFHLIHRLIVLNRKEGPVFREIQVYSLLSSEVSPTQKLIIREESGAYSSSFIELLHPYYLHL